MMRRCKVMQGQAFSEEALCELGRLCSSSAVERC